MMSGETSLVDSIRNSPAVEAIKRKGNFLQWGLGIGAAIALPLVVWWLAYFMLGVAALGAATVLAIVVGLAAVHYVPVVRLKFENDALLRLKAESAKNPIETMQNTYREKEIELHEKRKKIEAFNAKVIRYAAQRAQLLQDFPADGKRFEEVEQKYRLLLKRRQDKWQESAAGLEQFGKVIVRSQAIWEMSKASAELEESAGDVEANFMQRVRVETALDAVENGLAQSMAQLDSLLMERVDESTATITHQPADVIEMTPVAQKTRAPR